jgi:hypothetical protein
MPVLPEVLPGRASNEALESGSVIADDSVDVGLAIAGGGDRHLLEVHRVPAARLTQRAGEDDGRLEAKREDRRPTRRLRVASEEGHPRRGETDGALIDEHRHRVLLAHRPRHPPDGVGIVDHRHADALSRAGDVPVEQRVLHPASDGLQRDAARGDIRAAELPVPQVPADEEDALAARPRPLDDVPPVDALDEVEHLLPRV